MYVINLQGVFVYLSTWSSYHVLISTGDRVMNKTDKCLCPISLNSQIKHVKFYYVLPMLQMRKGPKYLMTYLCFKAGLVRI